MQLLLKFGANPNVRDVRGDAPLHYALRDGAPLTAGMLLKHGVNPNLADHRGKSPLGIARSVDTELERMVRRYGGK